MAMSAKMKRKLTRADFDKPVMYRGIRIDPLPREYYGEPSALILAIRDEWIEKYNKKFARSAEQPKKCKRVITCK
jgi:hypothetical protein